MRMQNAQGEVTVTEQEGNPSPKPRREQVMLQKTADYELDFLPVNDDGVVRTTTIQSRFARTLTSAVMAGFRGADAVQKYESDESGNAIEPSEAQKYAARLYYAFKGAELKIRKGVTKPGHGLNHFRTTKAIVTDLLETLGLEPSLFLSNTIPHCTEMVEIGEKLGEFSETVTGEDGSETTVEYKEGDDKYDGVEFVEWTKPKTDATYESIWFRKLVLSLIISVKDEDGKAHEKECFILDMPEHDFFKSQDSKYWFSNYFWGPDFISPGITGANFHNLGNQAITYKLGQEWVETCEENRAKYLKATENVDPERIKAAFTPERVEAAVKAAEKRKAKEEKTGEKVGSKLKKEGADISNLVVWTSRLKYAKIYHERSMYELCLQAVLNFGEKLKAEMLGQLFTLAENGTYSQNPIRHEQLLHQLTWKIKRDPSSSWDVVKGLKAWKANPKRTLEGLLEILENVDMTTIFCRHDGAPRNGKAPGLIFEVKQFINEMRWAGFNEDDETGLVSLTSKQKHLVKTTEAKTAFPATEQEEVKDAVQPLIKKKAVKKKAAKKKVTKKATKKTAKKQ